MDLGRFRNLHVSQHPLVAHKLALLRDRSTEPKKFRELVRELSWLLGYVHGVIHTPKDRLIERTRWFQWLNHHHYIHHVDVRANINFMLPVCDLLLGTQKWELTPQEAAAFPSFAEATRPASAGAASSAKAA